jgi:hypothetical protein
MRKFLVLAASTAALIVPATAGAQDVSVFPATENPAGSSRPSPFSQNKQNEPAVAIDPTKHDIVAAGSNDNIDLEDCNAGEDDTCPFTPGVGVSGIALSSNGGTSYRQPVYTGYSARVAPSCRGVVGPDPGCTPAQGPIGTLPLYFENGLASGGDPALAFGPRLRNGTFSWANGSRLYYANLASNFPGRQAFKGFEALAVSRLNVGDSRSDTANYERARNGDKSAWAAPVIASKQSSTTFSDKEAIWADNAESSAYFGNVYICNVSFRSNGGAPEPVIVTRSSDGGNTWKTKQVTAATNTNQTGGRQGCTVRTDSRGVVYLYYVGTDIHTRRTVFFQQRSFDGGATFERPRIATFIDEVGRFDPATGRFSFDGVAGARTSTFPSVDIANGAPSGAGAPDTIIMVGPDAQPVTPSDDDPHPNERVLVKYSRDRGATTPFPTAPDGSPPADRPDFPAVAIAPDGSRAWLVYENFTQPWQSTTAAPRLQQGVVRTASVSAAGVPGTWSDKHRAPLGDARGSSQNNLAAEFLGDYNYVMATNASATAVWNDVRFADDCPAIDAFRQELVDAINAGTAEARPEEPEEGQDAPGDEGPPEPPAPQQECPPRFGNTDIFGGTYTP